MCVRVRACAREGEGQFISVRVTPNRGGVTSRSQTPFSRRRGGPISKHVKVLERTKIGSWVPTEPEVQINYVGEGQQQYTRPTKRPESGLLFLPDFLAVVSPPHHA
jgi:hypothetical protein